MVISTGVRKATLKTFICLSVILIILTVPVSADNCAPDRIIIKYHSPDGSSSTSALTDGAIHAEIAADHTNLVPGLYTLRLPDSVTVEEAIVYYSKIPGVQYVEPDSSVSIATETKTPNTPLPAITQTPLPLIGVIFGLCSAAVVFQRR